MSRFFSWMVSIEVTTRLMDSIITDDMIVFDLATLYSAWRSRSTHYF